MESGQISDVGVIRPGNYTPYTLSLSANFADFGRLRKRKPRTASPGTLSTSPLRFVAILVIRVYDAASNVIETHEHSVTEGAIRPLHGAAGQHNINKRR